MPALPRGNAQAAPRQPDVSTTRQSWVGAGEGARRPSLWPRLPAFAAPALIERTMIMATNAHGQAWDQTHANQHAKSLSLIRAMRPRALQYAAKPVCHTRPYVSGTGTVGQVLNCTMGTWGGTPTSYAYQWYRDATAISGATTANYTLVAADQGHMISCRVTATNPHGSTRSPPSNAVGLIQVAAEEAPAEVEAQPNPKKNANAQPGNKETNHGKSKNQSGHAGKKQ